MWEWLDGILAAQLILVLFWAFVIYTIGASLFIILDNRQPSSTFAWIFLFLLLPLVGLMIYFLFGREIRPFSRQDRLARLPPEMAAALTPLLESLLERENDAVHRLRTTGEMPQMQGKLAEMLRRTNLAMLTTDNQVELLQDASEMYPCMEEDIRNAQHSIHMEYFTWQADEYMQALGDLLIEKAQSGVEVRILYDAVGSWTLDWLHRGYLNRLRAGGVEIYSYLNRFFLLSLHAINYRNHRKITVIDGKIGYTGGLNMGEEHLKGAGPYKAWRDTHLRIIGQAAAVLQGVFATSWFNTTNESLTDSCYFVAADTERRTRDVTTSGKKKPIPTGAGIPGEVKDDASQPLDGVPVQIVGSGPDSQWYAIQQLYFFMIPLANHHVYIQSPFFIPDPSIGEALKAAALAGVDVRIMCARRDTINPLSNWAANTYFDDMARAGVKIYLMQNAYMHAKTISIDTAICSVGTANMDLRSFQINYEINAVIYNRGLAHALEAQFHQDQKDCMLFDGGHYRSRRNIHVRLRDSIARLFSPLL
jgi:cardiolipin synthase A/B